MSGGTIRSLYSLYSYVVLMYSKEDKPNKYEIYLSTGGEWRKSIEEGTVEQSLMEQWKGLEEKFSVGGLHKKI